MAIKLKSHYLIATSMSLHTEYKFKFTLYVYKFFCETALIGKEVRELEGLNIKFSPSNFGLCNKKNEGYSFRHIELTSY